MPSQDLLRRKARLGQRGSMTARRHGRTAAWRARRGARNRDGRADLLAAEEPLSIMIGGQASTGWPRRGV